MLLNKPLIFLIQFLVGFLSQSALYGQTNDTLQVLFIGNSATYYNNTPFILEEISSKQEGNVIVKTRMIATGGATLKGHWNNDITTKIIDSTNWDYVILQEQSTFAGTYLINGEFRVASPDTFYTYANKFNRLIGQSNSELSFFLMWAQKDAPTSDWEKLRYAYNSIAQETKAKLIPIGIVWQDILTNYPDIELYDEDNLHPKPIGSYVNAATILTALSGKAPAYSNYQIIGNPVDENNGGILKDSTSILVDIDSATVRKINQSIRRVQQNYINKNGYLSNTYSQTIIEEPSIPQKKLRQQINPEGKWIGYTKLYPRNFRWPADMHLELQKIKNEWNGKIHISFGGKPDNIIREVNNITITDTTITFIDPKGPNGGFVKYQGVFLDNSIKGIAEIIVEDRPVYGIGEWKLTRK